MNWKAHAGGIVLLADNRREYRVLSQLYPLLARIPVGGRVERDIEISAGPYEKGKTPIDCYGWLDIGK